jgi:hypothetical protein
MNSTIVAISSSIRTNISEDNLEHVIEGLLSNCSQQSESFNPTDAVSVSVIRSTLDETITKSYFWVVSFLDIPQSVSIPFPVLMIHSKSLQMIDTSTGTSFWRYGDRSYLYRRRRFIWVLTSYLRWCQYCQPSSSCIPEEVEIALNALPNVNGVGVQDSPDRSFQSTNFGILSDIVFPVDTSWSSINKFPSRRANTTSFVAFGDTIRLSFESQVSTEIKRRITKNFKVP